MKWTIGIVAILAAVFAVGGCKKKNPCMELTDKMCKMVGADECKEMKAEAEKASDDDKKACEEQLKTVDEMIKGMEEAEKQMEATEKEGGGEAAPTEEKAQ